MCQYRINGIRLFYSKNTFADKEKEKDKDKYKDPTCVIGFEDIKYDTERECCDNQQNQQNKQNHQNKIIRDE